MKSFLQAFEESATSRLFEKENNILLFESENKGANTIELRSGWKRRLHLKTRPEQLGVDWLATINSLSVSKKNNDETLAHKLANKITEKVPLNITVPRTPDSETLFHLSYYELYKQYLLLLAKKRGFATGRVLSSVNGGLTVGLAGHTMFLPNTQASKKLLHKKALFSFLSYDTNYGSFVVSQQNAYRKIYKIWTKRLKRIKKN